MEDNSSFNTLGVFLILIFFILLSYAGYLSYKSIDWDVLTRLEQQPLTVPAPPSTSSASVLSATPSAKPATK